MHEKDKENTHAIPIVTNVKAEPRHGASMNNRTQTFSTTDDQDRDIRAIMNAVYNALSEKGYNPINQLVGYLLSEDPTYITNYKNARSLIRKVDRDELLNCLIRYYLGI